MNGGCSVLRAVSRLAILTLHIQYGLLLVALCRYRYGRSWFDAGRGYEIVQWWSMRACHILAIRLQVSGAASRVRGTLFVSNHISWIDIIALSSLIETKFLSKASVKYWPVIGWLACAYGTLFIKRSKNLTIRSVNENIRCKLANNHSLLIFPEGTTTDGKQLARFHSGLFTSVAGSLHFVQSIALRYRRDGQQDELAPYLGNDNFVMHLFRMASLKETRLEVAFATPFQPVNMSRHAVLAKTGTEIAGLLGHENSEVFQYGRVA